MDFSSRIEHTVLGVETTMGDVRKVMSVAEKYGMRTCIPPCYVAQANAEFPTIPTSTVIGFPHGNTVSSVKADEAITAVKDGANEIDMVTNIGFIKDDAIQNIRHDISTVVNSVDVPVKIIIEAPLLTEDEKHRVCSIAETVGANFVKTATGFNNGGATVEDVQLMSTYLPVKASGGIHSGEEALSMFEAGAKRIGASSGEKIQNDLSNL